MTQYKLTMGHQTASVITAVNRAVSVTSDAKLMVCLHNPACENTIPLIDLIKADVNVCLYYEDEDGEIKPLRPEIILETL